MDGKINGKSKRVMLTLLSRATWFLFPYVFFSEASVLAQVSTSDSLQIANIVAQAHEQLIKHNYVDATRIAKDGLNKSIAVDLKWGIINNYLIIGQAQKSLLDFPTSLNHYLQALSEIERQNDPKTLGYVNHKIGELFHEWGVPEKALTYYSTALSLQPDKSSEESVRIMEQMAEVYLNLNQKDQSLSMYFRFLEITQEKNDKIRTSSILRKIASIYYQSNDKKNSLKYNLQILEINRQLNDEASTAATLNVIGNNYKDIGDLDKSLQYYQEALVLNQRTNENGVNDNSIVTNLINIGVIYQSRGDIRNSIRSFNEALEIKEKKGTDVEVAVMHNYLASIYLTQENFAEAESHTKSAISLLGGTENQRMLATNYKRLSDIYSKQGDHESALKSYQSYSILKDSLLYREQLALEKERLKEYEIETTEKETKLSLIDKEMQALELRNEKEKTEREKQQITLLLKEKELQNVSLQKEQLEQARAVQHLQLQQNKIEKEKQEQEILLLQQRRDLQNIENELKEKERQKEIDFKNTRLALQQSQLERVGIRQQYLIYTSILFFAVILLILLGYIVKQRDNKKLQAQFDEINNQKQQIESINKSLIELNEEKNDLIGIVAHDLKSPLNQIGGMLEIIKLTAKDQPAEQQAYTEKIEQSTNRLKKMVSKILDVSAIEAKTLNITLEKINVTELLEEIVARFTDMAAKKTIAIVKEFEAHIPSIESDRGYLSEVLENLVSNAVKYSPLGKQITIKLSQHESYVRFEFIDQGQGISEKDMKNLFGKYRKLSARPTAGEDSTGLGLSIVKKYVQTLRGRVWCESEEGKGANFIVELPIA